MKRNRSLRSCAVLNATFSDAGWRAEGASGERVTPPYVRMLFLCRQTWIL